MVFGSTCLLDSGMVPNCSSTEGNYAPDKAAKPKPKTTENFPLLCTFSLESYAEDHLQVMFVECIPVSPGRGQTDE